MFQEVMIDEPIEKIIDDWDFLNDEVVAKFSMFRPVGQNIYGVRRRAVSEAGIIDTYKGNVAGAIELGPHGIVAVPRDPMHLYVTTGGTPHRVAHSFGYWHINDMDEVTLALPNPEGDPLGHFIVIMQTPKGNEGDSWAWYCEKCLTMLFERRYDTGKLGLHGFFKGSETAVRTYNSDRKYRTCPECSHLNPMAYCWNPAKDTPEERAARAIW